MGADGPYKISTELTPTSSIEKGGLSKVLRNHFRKINRTGEVSSASQLLLFRSKAGQLTAPKTTRSSGFKNVAEHEADATNPKPSLGLGITTFAASNGFGKATSFKPEPEQKPTICKDVEQLRSYCANYLPGVNAVYVTVEKSAKLRFFDESGVPLKCYTNTEERKRVAWVIESDNAIPNDREFFFMKELKGVNQHYPLRVKVHDIIGHVDDISLREMVCGSTSFNFRMGNTE